MAITHRERANINENINVVGGAPRDERTFEDKMAAGRNELVEVDFVGIRRAARFPLEITGVRAPKVFLEEGPEKKRCNLIHAGPYRAARCACGR